MRLSREELLAGERRWARPVGLAALAAIALIIASAIVTGSISGDGEADVLRSIHGNGSDVTISSILQAIGIGLLALPLYYLFRATAGRSEQVRWQFVGVIVAAPLFLSAASVLNGAASREAASDFLAGKASSDVTAQEARESCGSERSDDADAFKEEFGGGREALQRCAREEVADDEAQDALTSASARGVATGFSFGGRIGLTFALVYTCLYAMRSGLLTRFWGSLGMALGAVSLIFLMFVILWFVFLGLLIAGWVPGGRPPAWAAGEAIPWPSPGEKAAMELDENDEDAAEEPELGEPGEGKRKRKQRT